MFRGNMKALIFLPISMILFSACALVTPPPVEKIRPVGNDLIINEVFTLPPDRYYAYSWVELYNPTDRRIPWFDETYPASLNAVGLNGTFLQTENDGGDWSSPATVPPVDLKGVDFPYPDTGYVVGGSGATSGTVKRAVRVGTEYQFFDPVTLPTVPTMNAVSSISLTVSGYAVGNLGTILRTTTRGQTWTLQNSRVTVNLNAVKMATVSRVFAVGDSGTILRSFSSGTWVKIPLATDYATTNFHSLGVSGSLGDSAWAVGDGGIILGSRNSGDTWFPETTNTTANLYGSYFVAGTPYAWAVGENGVILRKKQAGTKWDLQNSGTTATLRAVTFVDSIRGWATGDNGTVVATTNSGRTWSTISSGTSNTITALYPLPLNIRILNRYVLQMWAQRKEFFFDLTTGTINFDYIVKTDTGYLYFDPEILNQNGVGEPPSDIPRNGFVIINSDSGRFQEHTDIGPGRTDILNVSIGYYYDSSTALGVKPVLWDLLQSGEVRLINQSFRVRISTNEFLGLSTSTVDVVRWGGFVPTPEDFPTDPLYPEPPLDKIYPQNVPAGMIPEWWSLSRYGDDVGADVDVQSTNESFYMSERPVPGYYSQINKNK
jgi:hypothetical protein